MGRDLRSDRNAEGLRVPHHRDRTGRGDVGDVDPGSRVRSQDDVARHHHVLGTRREASQAQPHALDPLVDVPSATQVQVLAVVDDRDPEGGGVFHGPPHQPGVHDRDPVVADRDGALGVHRADVGQPFPLAALGDRSDGVDVDRRCPARALHDEARDLRRVVDRQGVRHAADRREASGRRGPRTALDGFGVLDPRLSQMHVDVDESGRDDLAFRLQHLRVRAFDPRLDRDDAGAVDEHVPLRVESGRRVDRPSVSNQQAHAGFRPTPRRPIPGQPSGSRRRSRPGSGSWTAASRRPRSRSRGRG